MHLSILIPGGKGAGNGRGFDKKIKNWVKCPLVGHSNAPINVNPEGGGVGQGVGI